MTSFNKRVYEMLLRILAFAANHQQLFTKDSLLGQLLGETEAAVQKLSEHKNSQTLATGDAKVLTINRAAAREVLRTQLESISQTAKSLKLGQFWISQDKSDRSLVETGQNFATRAEPIQQAFIGAHLPADFIAQLKSATQDLEKALGDQVSIKSARIASTSAVERTRSEALAALGRLDPIMENLLRDDAPTLAAWRSARRVERYTSRKRNEPAASAETPSLPPITPNSAQPTTA